MTPNAPPEVKGSTTFVNLILISIELAGNTKNQATKLDSVLAVVPDEEGYLSTAFEEPLGSEI